jgi:hypothetical protein
MQKYNKMKKKNSSLFICHYNQWKSIHTHTSNKLTNTRKSTDYYKEKKTTESQNCFDKK